MSILPGANHVTITGGNITNVSNSVINAPLLPPLPLPPPPPPPPPPPAVANVSPQNGIVGILHSHSATAGLLDAKERFDAPKCSEGTRTSMILGMKKFVQDGDAASSPGLYWLHGPAGVGKSALAQSLSLSLKDEGDHAASFFFSRTSPGRNNGNQLVVTLAYQLAKNFPALQPFISKIVSANPDILTASNSVQMKSLIVDPLNKWHKKYNRSIRRWRDKLIKAKPHPRLILVDGLDECHDPNVQTDLILCMASAVRQLSIPMRFVVVSRPESHILATFELNPAFQGHGGVLVTKTNLGDDEDADEHITKFLLKEFAEIRRVHPVRDFLPQHWPHPDQVAQLVAKSSKGFIYAATVARYIKMRHNRPDECLNRILGLSEIPTSDKPYEPLDALYRHIFESAPEANKRSIHNIFLFFVLPRIWDGSTDPPVIEKELDYPRGHVRHVLSDLLCLVEFTSNGHIKILHASLPDFLLDKSRSGPLFINVGDVHATAAASYLSKICSTNDLPDVDNGFPDFLNHTMQANMSNTLLRHKILQMNLLQRFLGKCTPTPMVKYETDPIDSSLKIFVKNTDLVQADQRLRGMLFTMAYLLALVIQYGPEDYIRDQIAAIKTYVLGLYPAAGNVGVMNEQIIPVMILIFREQTPGRHETIKHIFSHRVSPSQNELREAIFELYCLMGAQFRRKAIESFNSSKENGGYQTQKRMRRGPNFWANIAHGIDDSSNIIPVEPTEFDGRL